MSTEGNRQYVNRNSAWDLQRMAIFEGKLGEACKGIEKESSDRYEEMK